MPRPTIYHGGTATITVTLPIDIMEALDSVASAKETSRSQVMRMILRDHFGPSPYLQVDAGGESAGMLVSLAKPEDPPKPKRAKNGSKHKK